MGRMLALRAVYAESGRLPVAASFLFLHSATMPTDLGAAVNAIDLVALTPVIRRSLSSPRLDVLEWTYRPLQGGGGDLGAGTQGIYRFAGHARNQGATQPWSLVLKVCTSQLGSAEASDWNYWRRELLAYQSGLLDHLPGGLAAPRCYGVVQSPEMFWLWLEDVTDELGPRWPLERYALAARHLGQFNGAYLAGQPIPSFPWLGPGWLRSLVAQAAPVMARLREPLTHPLQRQLLPAENVSGLLQLWAERQIFLDALDRLPQTLCHRDAFRRNLFARHTLDGQEQTVAIDWPFTGMGAVGAELAPLIIGSLAFFEVEMDHARELGQLSFEGYLEGLREAGWRGEMSAVRSGYAATSALIYGIGYLPNPDFLLDASQGAGSEPMMGRSIEEIVGGWGRCIHFLLELADEARGLLGSLDER